MNDNLLTPYNTNAIAATTSSQSRGMPLQGGITAVFYNDGPGLAFVSVGEGPVVLAVAPTLSTNVGLPGSYPVPVGQSHPIQLAGTDQYWAAVSLTTSNVYCTRGDGR